MTRSIRALIVAVTLVAALVPLALGAPAAYAASDVRAAAPGAHAGAAPGLAAMAVGAPQVTSSTAAEPPGEDQDVDRFVMVFDSPDACDAFGVAGIEFGFWDDFECDIISLGNYALWVS